MIYSKNKDKLLKKLLYIKLHVVLVDIHSRYHNL